MLVLGDNPLGFALHGTPPPETLPTAVHNSTRKHTYGWWAWNGLAYVGYGSSDDRAFALETYTALANDPSSCAGAVFTNGGNSTPLTAAFAKPCGAATPEQKTAAQPPSASTAPWYARVGTFVKAYPLIVGGGAITAIGLGMVAVARRKTR